MWDASLAGLLRAKATIIVAAVIYVSRSAAPSCQRDAEAVSINLTTREEIALQTSEASESSKSDRRKPPFDDLIEAFTTVRAKTKEIAQPLSAEDCQPQSMPDASPVKWHLAHTTWFFETFVLEATAGHTPFHPDFRFLYNSYYESVGGQHPRPQRGLVTRPTLREINDYRENVEEQILDLLHSGRLDETAHEVIEIGVHHEQQHQELILTDVKHLFARSCVEPIYNACEPPAEGPIRPLNWVAFPEGIQRIGHDGAGFAFDNEKPRHRRVVEAYSLANRLITCGEFLDFISDGGYGNPLLWLSDGWAEVCEQQWQAPLYWTRGERGWSIFTLSGRRSVAHDEPVTHLSYYEADAFARWAGARLPTEIEWELAAGGSLKEGNFLESRSFHPCAARTTGSEATQLFGDAWEWSQSPYSSYPGYRPAAGALGEYNGKFMANQMVLRGGSCVTPRSHIRATYRNFFPPQARWQFSGLRLARSA